MYEIDFLPVGDASKSGDAIALRYSDPNGAGHVIGIIDAGFKDTGEAVVQHVEKWFGTDAVDFVVSTHPDEDHINGMGVVMRGLRVANLLIHRPAQHGFPGNTGARPAEELVEIAKQRGTKVIEPFMGTNGFGNSLLIAGPSKAFYEQMLREQTQTTKASATRPSFAQRYLGTVTAAAHKLLDAFPVELPFDDAGGDNPRNNSAAIVSLLVDGKHVLLPSDAGVPAITDALDYLDTTDRAGMRPTLFALPHHGGRHNVNRDTLERILGPRTADSRGTSIASVAPESERPSPRVANASGRRGYGVFETRGKVVHHRSSDAPPRHGWVALTPLSPLAETDHD